MFGTTVSLYLLCLTFSVKARFLPGERKRLGETVEERSRFGERERERKRLRGREIYKKIEGDREKRH